MSVLVADDSHFTNGRISKYGSPALIKDREEIEFTRPILKVSIQDGSMECDENSEVAVFTRGKRRQGSK